VGGLGKHRASDSLDDVLDVEHVERRLTDDATRESQDLECVNASREGRLRGSALARHEVITIEAAQECRALIVGAELKPH